MAEEGPVAEPVSNPPLTGESGAIHANENALIPSSTVKLKILIDDETFALLQRHFMMQGKGRRPDLPQVGGVTNKLLLQLLVLKEETDASFRQLTSWLHKLVPYTETVSEGRIKHRVNAILDRLNIGNLATDRLTDFLNEVYDFDALPQPLLALGINTENLGNADVYDKAPQEDVSNHVVVCLSQMMTRENKTPIFVRKWLVKLSDACAILSDKKLKTSIQNTMTTYKKLSKNKKGNDLDTFLNGKFLQKDPLPVPEVVPSSISNDCKKCLENDKLACDKDELIKCLEKELTLLKSSNEKLQLELISKEEALNEVQKDKSRLLSEVKELKSTVAERLSEKKQNKLLEAKVEEISDTKLYYKRNKELNVKKEELERRVDDLENQLKKEQTVNSEQKKKIKCEQDLKNKYRKISKTLDEEKSSLLSVLNSDSENTQQEVMLKQRDGKCTLYSDSVRLLYMTLQGEANVAATQASKVVMLVAKYLFKKDFSLADLPCPRTCLNFMDEANHIGKQHIVSQITNSRHFTYGTDGTSREKRHYMEHHLVMDNGSTLSVGFTEVADDKANTLLEKSLELFDELSSIHCEAEEADPDETFKLILTKMKSLMSDRAANMKLFNKKMLEYKKDICGGDATIHFLYCNAHFLIGLAEETEKAVKKHEAGIEQESGNKLGRDAQPLFKYWVSEETSTFRLLRTAADVFGPRGDEKSGCREEWLAHCDILQTKSHFTSYRSNRFNNIFENATALLFHYKDALHFLTDRVSHTNKKLKSILFDLQDQKIISIITAIALLSTYLTTPYWALMNSQTPYGKFPALVQKMKIALDRWSSDAFIISDLPQEEPVFGSDFKLSSDVADQFLKSDFCDESLSAAAFKNICKNYKNVLERQLSDFLSGGIYGSILPVEIQDLLNTCPLTNLTGERLFGDLDYDMTKRRTASTFLRSTISMWKHNQPSKFLNQKTPKALKRTLASGRKHGKGLKEKHKAAVKNVTEKIKQKIIDNERMKKEKEVHEREKQAALLNDILSQGGLCKTKEDLDNLLSEPQALQNLKSQIRFRKYYMGAKDLRLTGNFRMLYHSLCSHLGFESDTDGVPEPPHKRRKVEDDDTEDDSENEDDSESSDSDLNDDEEGKLGIDGSDQVEDR